MSLSLTPLRFPASDRLRLAALPITVLASVLGLTITLTGCGSTSETASNADSGASAKAITSDGDKTTATRIDSLESVWAGVKTNPAQLNTAREASKELLWKGGAPPPLRLKALDLLISDQSPDGLADTRRFLRLRMPTETSWPVIERICAIIASNSADPQWKDMSAALVRSYVRRVPTPEDAGRPERTALLALHPGQSVEDIVFGVFTKPVEYGAPARPDDYVQKAKDAAWELLSRLDPDGSTRTRLLNTNVAGDATTRDLARSARELGVVPVTGSELAWLRGLLNEKDPRTAAWWTQTQAAVATLSSEQRKGLQFRHLEPVRWAKQARPDLLSQSREQLLSELERRLSTRRVYLKTEGLGFGEVKSRELLSDYQSTLVFGDLLSILVIDEALSDPAIQAFLFNQVLEDRADTSAEHGGVIWAAGQGGEARKGTPANSFAIRAYQPRPTQRPNDRTFIAPEEMFSDSSLALLHYHFHVQEENNRDYSGPGKGDLEYATTHGRNCLVFTSVGGGKLNVDYYQRGGATIDLGELRQPK